MDAVVADFGFARFVTNQESVETTDDTIGPIKVHFLALFLCQWMALESLVRGEYSQKSDIWSFGVVMWEIITQQEPFGTVPMQTVMLQVPKGLRLQIPKDCPTILAKLMISCWQEDTFARPTFQDVVNTFSKYNYV
jgi:serine/threonine protein kinase